VWGVPLRTLPLSCIPPYPFDSLLPYASSPYMHAYGSGAQDHSIALVFPGPVLPGCKCKVAMTEVRNIIHRLAGDPPGQLNIQPIT
jgi:hypothetical protein